MVGEQLDAPPRDGQSHLIILQTTIGRQATHGWRWQTTENDGMHSLEDILVPEPRRVPRLMATPRSLVGPRMFFTSDGIGLSCLWFEFNLDSCPCEL